MVVQEELVFTQQRVEAKKKEAETEKHLKQLNKRETGRLMVRHTARTAVEGGKTMGKSLLRVC